jgi:tetratricopeptide (TPR) repeat protein
LLQAASVIGKDVPFALLQAIADESEDRLRHGLSQLQAAEFLYEARLFPDLEYTFKHALTHDVAYGSLLHDRRRSLHARIMDAIERLFPERLGEQVELLARHALGGEAWAKAVAYLRQAGAKAFRRSANREAVAYFEQALGALKHLPETRETLEEAIDLRFDLRTALFPLGEIERLFGYLREAESLAGTLGDQRRLGWVSVYMAHYFRVTGDLSEARKAAQAAGAIAEALNDLQLRVSANYYLGWTVNGLGDYAAAEGFLRKVVALLEGERSRERCGLAGFPAVMARWVLADSLAERGQFDEGLAHAQEGIRIAETLDHAYSLVLAYWGRGHVHLLKGEFTEARRIYERALAACRDYNVAVLVPLTSGYLGATYTRSGSLAEGLSLLEQTLKTLESMRLRALLPLFTAYLGEANLLAGRPAEAVEMAGRALGFARDGGWRGFEAYALHLLGEIASHPDSLDAEAAEGHYRQAMALAEELGMRPLAAHCHLGLGMLYQRTGKRQQAQGHLARAKTMYREMDMRFWLEQAETELKESGT